MRRRRHGAPRSRAVRSWIVVAGCMLSVLFSRRARADDALTPADYEDETRLATPAIPTAQRGINLAAMGARHNV